MDTANVVGPMPVDPKAFADGLSESVAALPAPVSPFHVLEAQLSPNAKHAHETYVIAFFRQGQDMTVGQIRTAVRQLYGPEVDDELEKHFEARRQAVYPKI